MGFLKRLLERDDKVTFTRPPITTNETKSVDANDCAMVIDDVFKIIGRGTVATGRLRQTIHRDDHVTITRQDGVRLKSKINDIEAFRRKLNVANAGDSVGILLDGIEHDQIRRGDTISLTESTIG